jgi:hypothetical protein
MGMVKPVTDDPPLPVPAAADVAAAAAATREFGERIIHLAD